jgi:hypothetical protein
MSMPSLGRVVGVVLALALATGAAVALRELDPSQKPDIRALELLDKTGIPDAKVIALFTDAVRGDSANPYRWADLGQALADANEISKARQCFSRADALSRDIPQIWLREANFHFQLGEPERALTVAARVLKTVPDYDAVLFSYFTKFKLSPEQVLTQIGNDRRATRAYADFLIGREMTAEAVAAWQYSLKAGFGDDKLAASYVDGLIRAKRFEQARTEWAQYVREGQLGKPNFLFNGGFERAPLPSMMDWHIESTEDATVSRDGGAHDGHSALQVHFSGKVNLSAISAEQKVPVGPGRYLLRAWVRTDGVTTNEGPRLEISDVDLPGRLSVRSEPFVGTRGWTQLIQQVEVPSTTRLVSVRFVREPSQKFDNKIAGSVWLDSVELVRE